LPDYRGYAGKLISGIYRTGDQIMVLPSGLKSRISSIEVGGKQVDFAYAPQSAVITLIDDIDIGRGDLLVKEDHLPQVNQELDVLLCWMDKKPLHPGNKYILQINSLTIKAMVREIEYRLDVNTLTKNEEVYEAMLNDIVKVSIRTAAPLPFDSYKDLRVNGGAILIDETSNATVGACMIQ
jgi:sulfate adenylyltransferase subunit 1